MADQESYEVFAVRYALRDDRKRNENFIANAWTDPVHDEVEPIAYYVWAIRNKNRTIVIDTGFDKEESERRTVESGGIWRCNHDCSPSEGLASIGIDSREVSDVVITHLHYDHAGTLADFPAARFHLQEFEIQYATGPHMSHGYFSGAYTVDHIIQVVRYIFQDRVVFHNGDSEVAPGITVHHIGGHTMGMQCVRVMTKRGWVVLASDASHFYANFESNAPFPIVYNVSDMVKGFDRLRKLASSPKHVIPGHDPLVMSRYELVSSSTQGPVVRLDMDPGK
jgi:glyoxylase-like metal-dependent hydrolase (beta-lactamase superfamily II)